MPCRPNKRQKAAPAGDETRRYRPKSAAAARQAAHDLGPRVIQIKKKKKTIFRRPDRDTDAHASLVLGQVAQCPAVSMMFAIHCHSPHFIKRQVSAIL